MKLPSNKEPRGGEHSCHQVNSEVAASTFVSPALEVPDPCSPFSQSATDPNPSPLPIDLQVIPCLVVTRTLRRRHKNHAKTITSHFATSGDSSFTSLSKLLNSKWYFGFSQRIIVEGNRGYGKAVGAVDGAVACPHLETAHREPIISVDLR